MSRAFGERVLYTLGRAAGVVGRPIVLLLANNYAGAPTAQGVATALLASSLGLVAIAADPHRRYYASHFAAERNNGLAFPVYVVSIGALILTGMPVVSGIVAFSGGSISLVAATIVYFITEKLADEALRIRLFERAFDRWGRSVLGRTALQLVGVAAPIIIVGNGVSASVVVLGLAAANAIVFLPQVPRTAWQALGTRAHRTRRWILRRALRSANANRQLWLLSLAGTSVGYLDRIIALVIAPSSLAMFMLVVMCFSFIQMTVDFFYVSRHRLEFLQREISIEHALVSSDFLGSLALGTAAAISACAGVLSLAKGGRDFPIGYVAAIGLLQLSIAFAGVPREIAYWTRSISGIIRIEVAFWSLVSLAVVVGKVLGFHTGGFLAVAAGAAALRLALYVRLAGRARGPIPPSAAAAAAAPSHVPAASP